MISPEDRMSERVPVPLSEARDVQDCSSGSAAPSRRCICCRSNGVKWGLLRFGVMGGLLCFDLRQKMPGRGYYVCPKPDCLKKAWSQAFKRVTKVSPVSISDSSEAFVTDWLVPGYQKRYRECLLVGRQNGELVLGADAVEHAAREDRLQCYILATDASDATRKKYALNAERKSIPCIGLLDRSAFGQLLGASDKVVLGWLQGSTVGEEFQKIESVLRRFAQDGT